MAGIFDCPRVNIPNKGHRFQCSLYLGMVELESAEFTVSRYRNFRWKRMLCIFSHQCFGKQTLPKNTS